MSCYFKINRTEEGFEALLPICRVSTITCGYTVYNSLSASKIPGVQNALLLTNPSAPPFSTTGNTIACESGIRKTGLKRYSVLTGNFAESTDLLEINSFNDLQTLVECRYGGDYWSAAHNVIAADWFYNVTESMIPDLSGCGKALRASDGTSWEDTSHNEPEESEVDGEKQQSSDVTGKRPDFSNVKTVEKPARPQGDLTSTEINIKFYEALDSLTVEEMVLVGRIPFAKMVARLDESIIPVGSNGQPFEAGRNFIKVLKDGVLAHSSGSLDCHIRVADFRAIVTAWDKLITSTKSKVSSHQVLALGKMLSTFLQAKDVAEAVGWLNKQYLTA